MPYMRHAVKGAFDNSIWPTLILSFGPPPAPFVRLPVRKRCFSIWPWTEAEPCAALLAARLGRSEGQGQIDGRQNAGRGSDRSGSNWCS